MISLTLKVRHTLSKKHALFKNMTIMKVDQMRGSAQISEKYQPAVEDAISAAYLLLSCKIKLFLLFLQGALKFLGL